MPSARFRIDQTHVVHETIDGEVLAINLDTGTYYSLGGVGGQIWGCLMDGASIEAITQAMVDTYEGERTVIEAEVGQFIDKMKQEKLIVSDETSSDGAPIRLVTNGASKKPFIAPDMGIYSDMQDLLLLDPIHDTDESGWPVLKSPAAAEAKN
jgi:hypothetical protein